MALVWRHSQFVKFLKKNPKQAFEYRRDCFPGVPGYEVPAEYITEEIIEAPKVENTIVTEIVVDEKPQESIVVEETVVEENKIEVTEEEIKEKLRNAGIKFHHKSKMETLIQLCVENNLL